MHTVYVARRVNFFIPGDMRKRILHILNFLPSAEMKYQLWLVGHEVPQIISIILNPRKNFNTERFLCLSGVLEGDILYLFTFPTACVSEK